jgi:hypothetical protein
MEKGTGLRIKDLDQVKKLHVASIAFPTGTQFMIGTHRFTMREPLVIKDAVLPDGELLYMHGWLETDPPVYLQGRGEAPKEGTEAAGVFADMTNAAIGTPPPYRPNEVICLVRKPLGVLAKKLLRGSEREMQVWLGAEVYKASESGVDFYGVSTPHAPVSAGKPDVFRVKYGEYVVSNYKDHERFLVIQSETAIRSKYNQVEAREATFHHV